uniref:Si:ch211-237i5.4 n=1 Tax=Neolamprologus brichardi TaxID=32507 RepID=A0A3Q4IC46_NEOBR
MSLLSSTHLFFLLAIYSLQSLLPCVQCSKLCPHNGFEHVPRGLPHGTWLLELGRNNMSVIGTQAFKGLWSLRVLVLTNSQIEEIQPQAFFSLSFLEKLDLSWNKLKTLPVDFSSSLPALKELRLQHNNLHYLSGYRYMAICGSSECRESPSQFSITQSFSLPVSHSIFSLSHALVLDLSHNKLIDTGALAPLYSLAVLDLEGNNLHNLKFKTFISLHTTATHIQLSGNPWSCDCELHRVFSKILHVRHLHIDDYHNVTCQDPPQLLGASLAWVDSQLCVAETATVLVITVTVFVTVVAAVVMAERNRKRNRGKNWDTDFSLITRDHHSRQLW